MQRWSGNTRCEWHSTGYSVPTAETQNKFSLSLGHFFFSLYGRYGVHEVTEIQFSMKSGILTFKVTVDLQACLPKNHWHARVLCYNHRKVYIIVKVIKCRIIGNNFFLDLI